jgi:DNA-binding XRE family transcriptional regulator
MSGHHKWETIRLKSGARSSAEASLREVRREQEAYRQTLAQIRKARALTQTQLAEKLGISQAQVSRLETQPDLYLSSLARYLDGIGAELEIGVVFQDGTRFELTLPELAGDGEPAAGPHVMNGSGPTGESIVPEPEPDEVTA